MDLRVPFILVLAALPGVIMGSTKLMPAGMYLPLALALGAAALSVTGFCLFFAWRTQLRALTEDQWRRS